MSQKPAKPWQKDPAPFIDHGESLETKPELLTDFITPNSKFFVCNETYTPSIDLSGYSLKVGGDGVTNPLELSYEAVLKLPSHTVISYLECAGNLRRLYEDVLEGELPDDQEFGSLRWTIGGVGNAVWTGVSIRTLLEMAGLKSDAIAVNGKGLDSDSAEGGVSRPMPIDKALDPDTILAYHMNGETLPPDHGFPFRLIVPGWIGTNSVKWVGEILASTAEIHVRRNTEHYVFIGPEWEPGEHTLGELITTQNIKSTLALAWNAELERGKQIVKGNGRSPHAPISKVEWSADGGKTWQEARLIPPNLKYAWVRFEFEWDAHPGHHVLMTRATDEAGNSQPMKHPFNLEGYLFNMVYPHPVKVN